MKQGLPDLQPQALILPAGPESVPPTAAQFRDPAGEPLIPRDPRGYFQLSGSSSRQDSCIKATKGPWWPPFSVPFRCDEPGLLFSHLIMSNSLQPQGLQLARFPYPLSSRVCSHSCPSSWWYHPIISSSSAPFSSYPQSFPASGSFLMSQLFTSGSQLQLPHQSFQWIFRIDFL